MAWLKFVKPFLPALDHTKRPFWQLNFKHRSVPNLPSIGPDVDCALGRLDDLLDDFWHDFWHDFCTQICGFENGKARTGICFVLSNISIEFNLRMPIRECLVFRVIYSGIFQFLF